MATHQSDKAFAGSIPKIYEDYLVPLIFAPYAEILADQLAHARPGRVLEIAAGTGVVTRQLASRLHKDATIVATDLNQPMLDLASAIGTSRPVQWQQADAMQLPFADESFDAVVCQFGVMFFPDKARAFAETRRVLRAGGLFMFNVWDRIEDNEFASTVIAALQAMFPDDPPRFLARTPHGHFDLNVIRCDLQDGGFGDEATVQTIAARSIAASARIPAFAYCQGTPLRNEIESRDASRLGEATDRAEAAIASAFGSGAVDGKIQAHLVSVHKTGVA
jgi:SAM-dependent methyltransferase